MRPIVRSVAVMMLGLGFAGAGTTPMLAEGRHALVIGIDAYREITPLKKAAGDAEALKSTLENLGFTVELVLNADRRALNRAVSEFQSKLVPGDTALIHFSGHGVELDGQNYLLPADIPKPQSGQQDFIKAEAISLGDLVQRVASSGASTRIFIIDACRDNPFAQAGSRGVGGTRGLTRVEAPAGTFILYSAGYNQTALDRLNDADAEPTSVYTRVLTRKMTESGKPLAELAREVRSDVEVLAKSAGHEQRPAYYDELSGQFFFRQAEGTSLHLFRRQRLHLRLRRSSPSASAMPSMPPRQAGPRLPGKLSSDVFPLASTPTWRWPHGTSSRVQPDPRSQPLPPRHLSLPRRLCRPAPIFTPEWSSILTGLASTTAVSRSGPILESAGTNARPISHVLPGRMSRPEFRELMRAAG